MCSSVARTTSTGETARLRIIAARSVNEAKTSSALIVESFPHRKRDRRLVAGYVDLAQPCQVFELLSDRRRELHQPPVVMVDAGGTRERSQRFQAQMLFSWLFHHLLPLPCLPGL